MACRPEITGRKISSASEEKKRSKLVELVPKKKPKPVVLVPNCAAYSITEFCQAHRIAKPSTTNFGKRVSARARRARSPR